MPQNLPLISIITVNYNQEEVTGELLDSIRKISYPNYEIIVVDNASKKSPKDFLRKNYPEAKFIRSDRNLGFAGGNNIAVRQCEGDYFFFVNNDAEITEGCIETLLELFDKTPNLGIVSPKLCYYPSEENDFKEIIQYVGTTPVNNFTARNVTIGELEEDKGQYTEAKETPYVHGAAMMIPREVVEDAGMMSEDFFLYYEELDWCEQIRRAGYRCFIEPNAKVYHKESISVGKMSTLKTYFINRNRIMFMRRNKTMAQVMVFSLFLAFLTIPKNILSFALKGDWAHVKAFVKAVWWNISNPTAGKVVKNELPPKKKRQKIEHVNL